MLHRMDVLSEMRESTCVNAMSVLYCDLRSALPSMLESIGQGQSHTKAARMMHPQRLSKLPE
jgi:hypothetical protein